MMAGPPNQRIQFTSTERPVRSPGPRVSIPHKPSIPQVITGEEKARRERQQEKERKVNVVEHLMSPQDVATQYRTIINLDKPSESFGLTSQQAAALLQEHGQNVLTPPKKRHPFLKYLDYLTSLFNLLLILAGVLEYILLAIDFKANFPNTYLGAILIIVANINAFIEFYQQSKSQALLDSFLNMIPAKCMCLRDGKLSQLDASALVPGDVVFVRMGDKTPADILVFSASDCKVDNSSLTGESEPQDRTTDNDMKNPLEAHNLMFNSTLCVSGEAFGIVIRTGDNTVLGQIASLTAGEAKVTSPLTVEIGNFVKIIATIAIFTALTFFGVSFPVNNNNVSLALNFAIGVFVAWVPEGLPATVTILLTIAAKRMASQNVLVKDLQGVETLGAITLLATDKTGTLTRNQMTVANIWTCGAMYEAARGALVDRRIATPDSPGILEILHISSLCTRAKFDRTDVPIYQREILGDATESGLIRYASDQLLGFDNLAEKYPKVFEIPFSSETKWHMSIHKKAHSNGALTLYIKGAPERVWRLCNRLLVQGDGSNALLTDDHKGAYNDIYEDMASRGHRVLGFAMLELPGDQYPEDFTFDKKAKSYPLGDFVFVGLASLQDPPKHGVREAIGSCRAAGVKVIMVTGDHPLTAEAIARKINLMLGETRERVAKRTERLIEQVQEHEYNAIVIHGEQIDGLSDQQWNDIFWKDEIIFARTSPKHKLEIVRRAQEMGHIVGVTGDGVNDSPALKKADLGIAMNKSGSDVSKDAASMILLDDNFASTVRGIREGRLIFINLKKSIKYTISHSMPEVIPNLLYVIVPIPLPLTAILILVIDLGFELIAALSFAWDPPETSEGLMKLPPRKPVTPESAERFRRRQIRRTGGRWDQEANVVILPPENRSKFKTLLHNTGHMFTKQYWADKFEGGDAEVLVDGPLLSWAYLEIGIIEAVGAMFSFFFVLHMRGISMRDAYLMQKGAGAPTNYWTKDAAPYKGIDGQTQYDILAEAQSMYYWAIMTMQMFNLFACKTRYTLPFGRYMFANRVTFYCILAGAALAAFIIYTPGVEIVFGTTRNLLPLYWLIPMAFGCLLIAYAAVRMLITRHTNPTKWNPEIAGLQMHPTMWSQRSGSRRGSRGGE
uniref:Type IIC NA+/K+/H+-transporting ATPase n=2 Tax=Podospora anserina (strain S / ATCC MYA-4624 / DSM 980 / FGSC 10383) TaxID=515849 RepID=A0A090D7D5_PODAN|nr:Putative type IIC NA+/K+/H+-transporting ATPase [Podospora anserina S mat+]